MENVNYAPVTLARKIQLVCELHEESIHVIFFLHKEGTPLAMQIQRSRRLVRQIKGALSVLFF